MEKLEEVRGQKQGALNLLVGFEQTTPERARLYSSTCSDGDEQKEVGSRLQHRARVRVRCKISCVVSAPLRIAGFGPARIVDRGATLHGSSSNGR